MNSCKVQHEVCQALHRPEIGNDVLVTAIIFGLGLQIFLKQFGSIGAAIFGNFHNPLRPSRAIGVDFLTLVHELLNFLTIRCFLELNAALAVIFVHATLKLVERIFEAFRWIIFEVTFVEAVVRDVPPSGISQPELVVGPLHGSSVDLLVAQDSVVLEQTVDGAVRVFAVFLVFRAEELASAGDVVVEENWNLAAFLEALQLLRVRLAVCRRRGFRHFRSLIDAN